MTTSSTIDMQPNHASPVIESFSNIYFIGIGGIGMSNLVRYFLAQRKNVGGYDRTSTQLSKLLEDEGAIIHYQDNVDSIPPQFLNSHTTLIVYTPAVPTTHTEFVYFQQRVSP